MKRVWMWSVAMLLGLAGLLVVSGCHSGANSGTGSNGSVSSTASPTSMGDKVVVLVPCGQVGPFNGVAKLWAKQYPGVKLDWKMGNMVSLTEEVLAGQKKPDVFLSMGDLEIDRLQKAGMVDPATRTQYADNAVVITVPVPDTAGVTKLEDLTKPAVKAISVPDPEKNSVGKHAMEALKGAGIYDKVEGKITTTTFAADSKEMSEKGEVEANMAYLPCVAEVHVPGEPPQVPKGISITMIPLNTYQSFSCEGVVMKSAKNPAAGQKLLELLKSPEAQKLFKEWSFRRDGLTK